MKKIFTTALLVTTFLVTGSAFAVDSTKIGGVSLQEILDNSSAGKGALSKLQKMAEKEKNTLQAKQEAVKALEKELGQQRLMMRESTVTEKENELRRLKREFELYRDDVQQALQREQANIMRKILADVVRHISDFAKKEGFAMIIEKGGSPNLPAGVLIYMDSSVDITSDIIKLYDEEVTSGKEK